MPQFKARLFNSSGHQLLVTNKHHLAILLYTDYFKVTFQICSFPAFLEWQHADFFWGAHTLTQEQPLSGFASWARITILFSWFSIICCWVDMLAFITVHAWHHKKISTHMFLQADEMDCSLFLGESREKEGGRNTKEPRENSIASSSKCFSLRVPSGALTSNTHYQGI